MSQKYMLSDFKQMTIGEISQVIGYDYRDFMQAGGTMRDAVQIANGRKHLSEFVDTTDLASAKGLTDEELDKIRKRPSPALKVVGTMSLLLAVIFALYAIASIFNLPNMLTLIIAFVLPIGFVFWRGQQRLQDQ